MRSVPDASKGNFINRLGLDKEKVYIIENPVTKMASSAGRDKSTLKSRAKFPEAEFSAPLFLRTHRRASWQPFPHCRPNPSYALGLCFISGRLFLARRPAAVLSVGGWTLSDCVETWPRPPASCESSFYYFIFLDFSFLYLAAQPKQAIQKRYWRR